MLGRGEREEIFKPFCKKNRVDRKSNGLFIRKGSTLKLKKTALENNLKLSLDFFIQYYGKFFWLLLNYLEGKLLFIKKFFCLVTAIFIFVFRYDRDNYIDILWSNVINGADDQFEKYGVNVIDQLNEPYDFGSIMVIKLIFISFIL